MEVTAFVIGCAAFGISLVNAGWNVFTWRHAQRFDVRVRIDGEPIVVASGKYEVTVVIENHGATSEAVQEVWLLYAEHGPMTDEPARIGPPSLHDRKGAALPPRRNVRRTYDLLASRFAPFPSELTALVVLESGERRLSAPYRTSPEMLRVIVDETP